MNKNRYRIIFSQARNMFIAVAENVKSQTKTSGQSTLKGNAISDVTPFHKMWQVKTIVTSMSLLMAFSPVYANIQVDPSAQTSQKAVIGVGQNQQKQNVPVVNIQTAKNGISHNVYTQFDVLQPGVVLNNSRSGANSVIVGKVSANPFLNTGEARVILNEVNSAAASKFMGNLEVVGQRADVIIANPSGIVVNGGGFINANKGILTTGKPQMNADGSIKQFVVDQGKVTINGGTNNLGLGGNKNNAEFVDIYTRALEANAQLHANQGINVITGANTVSADLENVESKTTTAAKPTLAVDVKALGGMYANNIYIMGTEKGLGVNNAGTLTAINNLIVTSSGQIQHTGTIQATSPTQSVVNIQTLGTGAEGNITSSGLISSKGLLHINSENDLNITAKEVKVDVGTISPLILTAKNNLNIAAKANVRNYSTDKGDIYLEGKNITLGEGALIGGNGEINLNANEGIKASKAALLSARHGLNLVAKSKIKLDEANLYSTNKDINLQSTNADKALSSIEINAGSINAKDHLNIYATGDVSLKNIDFVLDNIISRLSNLNIYSGNNLLWDFSVKILPQFTGKVQAEASNKIDLIGNQLSAKDNIELQANQLNLGSGLTSQKEINVISKASDLVLTKDLNAQGDINVSALAGKLTANSLKANSTDGRISILASKDVNINSNQNIDSSASYDVITTNKTKINGTQGISLGSIGDGTLKISASELSAKDGDIKLGGNGLKLLANNDVSMHNDDFGKNLLIPNILNAKNIYIDNKNNELIIEDTTLKSFGHIQINSNGKSDIKSSFFNAQGNVEIFAKDNLILDGITSTSQQHTALNSQKNIYINSTAGVNDVPIFTTTKVTQLSSQGVLSATSSKNQNIQNAKLTGGAVLIEAGGSLNTPKSVELNATGSALLKNNTKLSSVDGDLTIQTNNALTIDPKILTLKATGDIELISKKDALTLIGHNRTNGNGSEQVVKLNTINGGINLEGTKVELQGSELNAQKDIKIISSNGDLIVSGIKNSLNNHITLKHETKLLDKSSFYQKKIKEIIQSNEYILINKKIESLNIEALKIRNILYEALEGYGIRPDPLNVKLTENGIFVDAHDGGRTYYVNIPKELNIKRYEKIYKIEIPEQKNKLEQYNNKIKEYNEEIDIINTLLSIFNSGINGAEHIESILLSNQGNINITSAQGTSISGAELIAKTGLVNIEAQGPLSQTYTSTAQGKDKKPITLNASIIIDGTQDFYDKGNENDTNYSFRTLINPTIINGSKGVNIKAVGNTAKDNLVMQAVGIVSENGDVKIEANKNILFDAAIEQSYDRATKVETKKSWGGLKKKTVTTKTENNDIDAASVDISGKNVFIESKEKNPNNSIDIYSGKFTADGGKISIRSGGNLNFLTVEESSSSTTDVTKKSSFAGIKYNKSKTNATRDQVSELPSSLKADYIGTKSGFDTRLVGTEFEYLKGATIESGGKLELIVAKTKITDLVKKEKNSVVWQSMQDKGSITETAQLPRFNGATPPEFKAAGGLSVQIPIGEKEQEKVQIRDEILKLADQPGNQYLKDLVNRNDVDWQKIILTQKDWDYKSQGLTPAGAAIIVIIVTVLTSGAASGAASTISGLTGSGALGAGAGAAVTSLATQASISLINNGGDIGKTLKDLGSKNSVQNLVASVVTASLLSQVGTALNLKPDSTIFSERLINNFTTAVGSTLVQTAVKGGDLEENLKVALLSGLAGAIQGELASQIGFHLDKVDPNVFEYTIHKIAHAAIGCATAAATKASCEAGAIGAGVGEIIAGLMIPEGKTSLDLTDDERNRIKDSSKILAGVVSAYAGYDVNTAANSANVAVENNSLAKLATTGGKIAYKVAKRVKELQAKGQTLKPADVVEMFKKEGVQGVVDIGDNIMTLISPTASLGDKALAAIDLVIGVDLKAGKNISAIKLDRNIVGKNYSVGFNKNLLNKAGEFYPNIPDLRTGRTISFPTGNLKKVPAANRVAWGAEERNKFIKEWYAKGYTTSRGGWAEYDIHHIKPREYGGNNEFWNLTPVQRKTHQQAFNSFWRNM
ncbi:DUF637 domain-containing protein [Acinetobacter gerneri]|jgi:filamentous hemagglutinin|uniref:two-partner secretion domain-containing protein n=1 Tax=Acinetobacter gerneri TaxID=202952 RepID=UPI0023F2C962|nr:DUF637 domain-containing protein [Acinetobacter gerneri]MCH4244047.1 DUF637 domain-containing protein [Acinetobacter gerneri]